MQNKIVILVTAIGLTVLSLPSYARAGGAGVGYGNRGAAGSPAGAPGVPAAGAPGYGARGVPAAGAPGYGTAGRSGANVNGGANRTGARR